MALVSTLIDDFNDNSRNSSLWDQRLDSGTVAETGNQLLITPSGSGFGYGGYQSVAVFDLTSSRAYVKVPTVTNNVAGAETQFALYIDSNNEVSFVKGGGSLIPRYRAGGVNDDGGYPGYNASNHIWWSIRESSGTIYFETSTNGTSWTAFRSIAHTYTSTQLQGVQVRLLAGQYQAVTGQGTAVFDEMNNAVALPPPPTTDAGRLEDVYAGYKTRHMRADGVVFSHPAETRAVSEGQAYLMQYAVQFNDQTIFDLVEAYSYAHFDRRNAPDGGSGINTPANSYNLMAYSYSTATNKVLDWAAAYDADIDRAVALLWAHNRWGSGGTINYLSRAQAIMDDMVTYGLRLSSFDGKYYMVSGTGNMSISEPEMNNSYLDPAAFRLFAQYNTANSSKWLSAVSSSHDIINRTALAVLPNPAAPGNTQATTAKLPANWVTMNFTTGVVTPLTASYRDTNYTYDAFRQTNRLLYDYITHGDTTSLARLQDYKSFLASEWTTKGYIRAEYFHDGSEKETYSNRMFYYAAYQVLTANDPTNTAGVAIYNTHLQSSDMYKQDAGGSYFDSATNNSGDSGYYGLSWLLFDEMQRLGYYKNYGQKQLGTTRFFAFF